MKQTAAILTVLFLILYLSACSKGTYEDGYADGYDDGYRAAIASAQKSQPSSPETSTSDGSIADDFIEKYLGHDPSVLPVSKPDHGHIFEDIDREKVAPLTIKTTGTDDYYFVLDPIWFPSNGDKDSFEYTKADMDAKYTYIKFFADADSVVDLLIPLGNYEIYYATGSVWYGEDHLFGADTVYHKCDDEFLFTFDDEQYSGWTVEFEPVINGNLDTEIIDATDFP